MAQGDVTWYNAGLDWLASNDWSGAAVIRMALIGNAYSPNIDTDEDYADVSASEITAANYVAEGELVGSRTTAIDDTNDEADCDHAIVTWTSLGTPSVNGPITFAVVMEDTGTPATSTLLYAIAITDQPNGADYSIDAPAGGGFSVAQV
jgi:hypothetical protein